MVATDVSRGWLEGGKTRVNSTAWIGRNARESTFRGKWEYPGSNGASGPVIVSRLPPWGNVPRKNDAPGPGNRFQLAKLPYPRTFLRVPFTSRGPRATDRPTPLHSRSSILIGKIPEMPGRCSWLLFAAGSTLEIVAKSKAIGPRYEGFRPGLTASSEIR